MQPRINTSMMLVFAALVSICQDSAADLLVQPLSKEYLEEAVKRHLVCLEATDQVCDDPRRLHSADDIQAPGARTAANDANVTSRRLQIMPILVTAVEELGPWVAKEAIPVVKKVGVPIAKRAARMIARKAMTWWGRRLGKSVNWRSVAPTGVNVGFKPDALHKVSHEAAALAHGLKHLAGPEEHTKMSNPDVAARFGAAIVHDVSKVTAKMTAANIQNPTKNGYVLYSSWKHPDRQFKVGMATGLSQLLVDMRIAKGRTLLDLPNPFQAFTDWFKNGVQLGFLGAASHHVVKNDIMQGKVGQALDLFDSDPKIKDTVPKTASACACAEHEGCDCSWVGAARERCGADDGSPCFASCCYNDAEDQSLPCCGLCDQVKWSSPQSCYEKQCQGCPSPETNSRVPEACADCGKTNCDKSNLISKWAVEDVLETKPSGYNQLVPVSVCLSAGVALMLGLGVVVSRRSQKQSSQTPYAIANRQEDGA